MTLWGHQVQFVHACCMYVWCALHKVLGISPTGTNCLNIYIYILFFLLIKHLKPRLRLIEFRNFEAKEIGEGANIYLI